MDRIRTRRLNTAVAQALYGDDCADFAARTTISTWTGAGGALALGLTLSAPASAATFPVTNTSDAGVGSLRDALDQTAISPGADTITFAAGVSGVIALSSGELVVDGPVTISGPGASVLAIDGNASSRVMRVAGGGTVAIRGLTLRGGNATGGGALRSEAADLVLEDCVVSGSTSPGWGGGLYFSGSTVTMRRTRVSDNGATRSGGGIEIFTSDVVIEDSVISGNTAKERGGGLYLASSSLQMRRSTISGNSASTTVGGGGIHIGSQSMQTVLLENVTISGNSKTAGADGALGFNIGGALGRIRIAHSTITENVAITTAGAFTAASDLVLDHTIVAGNFAPSSPDVSGSLFADHSLIGVVGGTVTGTGNIVNVDAQLGPLANNGGLTRTHLLDALSPALDAGDAAFTAPPATDQRVRPRVARARIDIGAVENGVGDPIEPPLFVDGFE